MAENNSKRNTIILIVVAAIIGVLLVSFFLFKASEPGLNVTDLTEKGTKFSIHNNGTTWAVMDIIMENVTVKNGSVMTFYGEVWIEPKNGSVTIDLSKLLGYGNEKLPPGTTIRIVAWKGLYNSTTPTPNQDLNISFQGWSNQYQPTVNDSIYNVSFQNLSVGPLPTNISTNTVIFSSNWIDLSDMDQNDEFVYEEELLTVNADGSVTITFLQPPVLCDLMAHLY